MIVAIIAVDLGLVVFCNKIWLLFNKPDQGFGEGLVNFQFNLNMQFDKFFISKINVCN